MKLASFFSLRVQKIFETRSNYKQTSEKKRSLLLFFHCECRKYSSSAQKYFFFTADAEIFFTSQEQNRNPYVLRLAHFALLNT